MSVDFLTNDCVEISRNDKLFGICDDQDNTKAYSDTKDPKKWIAIIKNENSIDITFTPIDNCLVILKKDSAQKESTCDGMLTFSESLYFLELKDQLTGGWIPTAIGQLENTIKLLIASNDLKNYRYRKAIACNRRHRKFNVIDNEFIKRFFKTYGFRIHIQAEITIK